MKWMGKVSGAAEREGNEVLVGRLQFTPLWEKEFQAVYAEEFAGVTRVALGLSATLLGLFGLLDIWAAPNSSDLQTLWILRYGILCPIFVLGVLWSFHASFRRWMQPGLALVVVAGGVAIAAMVALARREDAAFNTYYVGMILVSLGGYTFIRLRFWYALLSGLLIMGSYEIAALFYQNLLAVSMGPSTFVTANFFFITANFVGGFACYYLERYTRRDFLHRKAIERERAKSEHALQREAADALRQSEERFRTLVETSVDGISILDRAGRIKYASPSLKQMLGYSITELQERNFTEFIHPADVAYGQQIVGAAIQQPGAVSRFELRALRQDGAQRLFEGVTTLLPNGDLVAYNRDITERKQAELALQQQNTYLSALHEMALSISNRIDARSLMREVAARAAQLLQATDAYVFVVTADGEALESWGGFGDVYSRRNNVHIKRGEGVAGRVWETGEPVVLDDYRMYPQRISAPELAAIRAMAGVPLKVGMSALGVLGVCRTTDDTPFTPNEISLLSRFAQLAAIALDNVRLYEQARESEARFRQLAENIDEIFWLTDSATRKGLYVSPAREKISGHTHDTPWLDVIHPADRARVHESIVTNQINGDYQEEYRIVRPDGEVRWVQDRAFPIQNEQGQVYRIAGVVSDITARKQSEEKLRESETRFRTVVEISTEGIVLYDQQTVIHYASPAFERMLGYVSDELVGQSFVPLVHPDDLNPVMERFGELMKGPGQRVSTELRLWRKDGAVRTVYGIAEHLSDGNIVAFIRDITEQKQAEEKLRLAERRFRAVFDQPLLAVRVYTPDGKLADWNRATEQLVNATTEQLQAYAQTYSLLDDPDAHRLDHLSGIQRVFAGEAVTFPPLHRNYSNGKHAWVNAHLVPVKDDAGMVREVVSISQDVTVQQEADQKLRESEALYRTLIEASTDGIAIINTDGIFTFVSAWYEKLVGYSAEELRGKSFTDFIAPESLKYASQIFAELLTSGTTPPQVEVLLRRKDGKVRVVEASARTLPDGRVVSFARDITERKEAEAKIRESETLYRTLIETSTDAFTLLDPTGHYVFASPQFEQISGYPASEIVGQPFTYILPPAELERVNQIFLDVVSGQAPPVVEVRMRRKDGVERVLEASARVLPDGRIASFSRDITERKQVENKIRESETLYRTLIEASTDGIDILNPDGTFNYVSPQFEQLTGYFAAELVGQPFDRIVPPAELKRVQQIFAELITPGAAPRLVETTIRRKDGALRVIEASARVLPDGRLVTYNRDISERKAAEEALRRLNEELEQRVEERTTESKRLAAIIEAMPDYVGIADIQGNSLYINRAGRRLVGKSENGETLGNVAQCYPPEDRVQLRPMFDAMQRGETWAGELDLRHLAGHRIPTDHLIFPLRNAENQIESYAAVIRDITERKRADTELRQAKEAAEAATRAKSEFLANMSHEIRTPMNAVIGMTSLLLDTPLDAKQREFVETIRTGGDSLLTIINDILDFSKIEAGKLVLERQPFDLRACIESALDLIVPHASDKKLEIVYFMNEQTPPAIVGDATRLRQVLVNLLSNAVKFTEQGEVMIEVFNEPSTANSQSLEIGDSEAPPDARFTIHFTVRDTGIGIPADKMDRLFKMFSQVDASTTREYGGTGLGLAISKRLVELMGGTMWAESDGIAGQGSAFHFTIKVAIADLPPRAFLQTIHPDLTRKRVLIVDDNATNRRILNLYAQKWGMSVCEASTPHEALALIQGDASLDLAILDMHMPEMDGVALAKEIRQYRNARSFPLIMLTSISKQAAQTMTEFASFLTKPIKPSQLYDVLVNLYADLETATRPTHLPMVSAEPQEKLAEMFPLRILLAEDVVVNQKFAMSALERMGYRADVVANGLEAVAAVKRQMYDVILMDVQMPEMDGLEATRRIRQLNIAQPLIIAMTANAMQGDRELCLQAGMDHYISKPVYLKELRAALAQAGQILDDERQARGAEERSPEVDEQRPKWDDQRPMADDQKLRTAEPSTNAQALGPELIAAFLEEAPSLVDALQKAIELNDAKAASAAAHSLKGSSSYVGAESLAKLCADVEQKGRNGELSGISTLAETLRLECARVCEALRERLS